MKQSNSRNSAFQLTASQGGWRIIRVGENPSDIFQLTASQGGWPFLLYPKITVCVFQLTASQGGWPASIKVIAVGAIISTHSLTRRLTIRYTIVNRCVLISTHSLTRRLTGNSSYILSANYISTHSLTRRLTTSDTILDIVKSDFNSQPHKEADEYETEIQMDIFISTHSLTRRLTTNACDCAIGWSISTHSLTRRLTIFINSSSSFPKFQLTASQGGWQSADREIITCTYFNSQPHKEADWSTYTSKQFWDYFNSQPHKEADGNMPYYEMDMTVFQLTASQGGWLIQPVWYTMNLHFNSQPHKEADFRGPRIRISSI